MEPGQLIAEGKYAEAAEQIEKNYNPSTASFKETDQYVYALAMIDRRKAIEVLKEFAEQQPTDSNRLYSLFGTLPHKEHLEREKHGLDTYMTNRGAVHQPKFVFCEDELRQFNSLLTKFPNNHSTTVEQYKAANAFLCGDYADCEIHLSRIRGYESMSPRIRNVFFSDAFYDKANKIFKAKSGEFIPHIYLEYDVVYVPETVFVSFCDVKFYRKYTENLVKSFAKSGSKAVLHIHEYGGDSEYIKESLKKHLPDNHGYSFEDTPDDLFRREYFATVRPIHMVDLMQSYGCPVVNIDGDVMFNGDTGLITDQFKDNDAVLARMPGRTHYHQQCNGTVFGYAPSENGYKFARDVANYIFACYSLEYFTWYGEQTALNQVRIRHAEDFALDCVGPEVYNSSYDCLLVPQKVPEGSPEYEKHVKFMEELSAAEVY